jgi:transcription initiation factor IIE alpha subunit
MVPEVGLKFFSPHSVENIFLFYNSIHIIFVLLNQRYMYTKEEIQQNISTNPKWIERSLIVLYERQTYDERHSGETTSLNGIGFNSSDSRYLSYCSRWLLQGKHLNQKHLEKCGGKLKKYWKQIESIIKEKGNN